MQLELPKLRITAAAPTMDATEEIRQSPEAEALNSVDEGFAIQITLVNTQPTVP